MNPSDAVMPKLDSYASSDDEFDNVVYTFTRRPEGANTGREVRIFSLSAPPVDGPPIPGRAINSVEEYGGLMTRSLPAPPADEEEEDDLEPIDHLPPLKHFLHVHVMPVYQLRRSDKKNCMICSLLIKGNAYGCKRCNFFIHELCFGFPRYIRHLGHSAHPLELVPTKYAITTDDFTCVACGFGTEQPNSTSPVFTVHYRCIPHQLALHLTCASAYLSAVIDDDSNNPVSLYNNFPLRTELGTLNCHRCRLEVKRDSWVFFNWNSTRIAHFTCVTEYLYGRDAYKDFILGVTNRLGEIQVDDAWMNKSDGRLVLPGSDDRQICHRHVLKKWSKKITPPPPCQLCGLNIDGPDVYGCKACKYFFHDICSKIPQEIQHPGHTEHRLTLVCIPTDDKKRICRACGDNAHGFLYACSSCEFYISLDYGKCVSYPQALGIKVASGDLKEFALVYKFPYSKEASAIKCDKCSVNISKDAWVYYNRETDLKYHIKCAAEKANLDLGWTAAINRLTALKVD